MKYIKKLMYILLCLGTANCFGHKDANTHMHSHGFEDLVERFENPDRDKWQKPDKVIDYIQKKFPKKKTNELTVADLGAGTGYFSFRFLDKDYSVIALDVNDKFLNYMKERVASHPKKKNLRIQKIEKDSIQLPASSIDILISVNVYHHIENRVEYFKTIKKLLKQNGLIFILDFKDTDTPMGPPNAMKVLKAQVVDEMMQAGFRVEVEENLLPYQNIYILK